MAYSLILKRFILLLATYPAVLALKVDSPAEGASWNTYSTAYSQAIQKNVSTSDSMFTVAANSIQGAKAGSGFQINLVATGNNAGILAQSGQFNITALASSYNTTSNSTGSNSTASGSSTSKPNSNNANFNSSSHSSAAGNAHSSANRAGSFSLHAALGATVALSAFFIL
ncbi:hypothetical protein BY996DRAFT_6420839 [Phakopsora pachyrhizi]|nr:hypothetical protein BY996DRAFT_6420839 [Phakopsora pachyrhizi]